MDYLAEKTFCYVLCFSDNFNMFIEHEHFNNNIFLAYSLFSSAYLNIWYNAEDYIILCIFKCLLILEFRRKSQLSAVFLLSAIVKSNCPFTLPQEFSSLYLLCNKVYAKLPSIIDETVLCVCVCVCVCACVRDFLNYLSYWDQYSACTDDTKFFFKNMKSHGIWYNRLFFKLFWIKFKHLEMWNCWWWCTERGPCGSLWFKICWHEIRYYENIRGSFFIKQKTSESSKKLLQSNFRCSKYSKTRENGKSNYRGENKNCTNMNSINGCLSCTFDSGSLSPSKWID